LLTPPLRANVVSVNPNKENPVQTDFSISITSPGHMEEAPEATFIDVRADQVVVKRLLDLELRLTGEACDEVAAADQARADLAAHDFETPFEATIGQWVCRAVAKVPA
jgi:hypothetical protein